MYLSVSMYCVAKTCFLPNYLYFPGLPTIPIPPIIPNLPTNNTQSGKGDMVTPP